MEVSLPSVAVWIAVRSLSNGKTHIPMHQTEKAHYSTLKKS